MLLLRKLVIILGLEYARQKILITKLGRSSKYWMGIRFLRYCPEFGDGAKITVHLDMNKRTLAFTVNGTKYPNVGWNLPSKLYPVVSLRQYGHIRIQPYRSSIYLRYCYASKTFDINEFSIYF